jgi:two-component system, NarL family, response regulator NreC
MKSEKTDKGTVSRILIADANSFFRDKMKQMITDHFHSILTSEACNEREVLHELSQHTFDLLILDLELSDGSGFNVLKKIQGTTPVVPVLGISMFPVEKYEENAYREGASGYVSKVNLSNELIGALQQIFQGKRYFSSQGTGTFREKS